ncbi:hypothetical protein [Myroides indicus]|uniref:Outer membrane protein with beta-barrel domain n=1 Tax=Myroides indicus TaxID=1323422 RepID=A0A4R7F6G4_9FLAO|nr:hypothetical protein [Myroides indicus]TDS65360.1 hypothetical protein C8P70_102148 [Myroides indicus]
MKKLVLVMLLIICVPIRAQEKEIKWDVSLGGGVLSVPEIGSGFGDAFGTLFTVLGYNTYTETSSTGTLVLNGKYAINPKVKIGMDVAILIENEKQYRASTKEYVGNTKYTHISFIPRVDWYWNRKTRWNMYSSAGVGLNIVKGKEKMKDEDYQIEKTTTETKTAFIVIPFGVEYGKAFKGFAEVGIGYTGLLQFGIRYSF